MSSLFYYIIFIICGLVVGSFLEVISYRLPRNISIIKPRSFCTVCKNEIKFYDNIPIISFLVLKGRCRKCKTNISLKAPLIELITASLFALNYFFFDISLKTLSGIVLCSALVAISVIDMEFRIIPNKIVLPLAITGLILSILINPSKWWMPLAFGAGAFIFMFLINLIYPRGMGMGDVKLSLMTGVFLVKNIIVALFLGFLAGSLFGLIVLIKKRKLKQTIPFGPFISAGSIIALFYGDYILKWYSSFLY